MSTPSKVCADDIREVTLGWGRAAEGEVSFTPKVSACNLDPASIAVVSLCSPSLQTCSWQAVPLIPGGVLYVSRMEAKTWKCW